jgi:hypothetical protein
MIGIAAHHLHYLSAFIGDLAQRMDLDSFDHGLTSLDNG